LTYALLVFAALGVVGGVMLAHALIMAELTRLAWGACRRQVVAAIV
jgi:hypothetical protein